MASTSVPQVGSSWEDSTAKAASVSSPQTVSPQAVSSSQAVSADPQVVSTSASQAGSSQEDNPSQVASTSSPQTVSSQTVTCQAVSSSQAENTGSQAGNTSASQAGSPLEDSASQAVSTSSQTHSTNSQGASATLPQAPQASRQPNSTNTPQGSPRGNSLEIPNPKWVINLSSKPLTQAQRSVLAKGPNFAVTPRHPPNLEYIMTIEAACTKL